MKRSLLALAALTAFAGAASAQSSVTLFGIVDVNARSVDNAGSAGAIKSLSTDGNASSRIGVRGVEDLGGGLRGGFWLEGALSPDNGGGTASAGPGVAAGGQTWQRRSTVSLIGAFGEIRLGRDYTPTFWNHTTFDPFGTNGVGSQTNLMTQQATTTANSGNILGSPTTTLVRANNTIGYFLPAMGGLYGQIMVAAGEGTNGNKYQGFRLGYAAGPINIAGAYGVTDNGALADVKGMNLGASFNAGFMTVMGQYHKYEFGNLDQTNYVLGALVPMGAGTIKASYGKADLSTGPGATQIAVGYVYDLSKRTALYTHYSKVSNDAGLRFVASNSGATMANGVTGRSSTGYEFGVRHSF